MKGGQGGVAAVNLHSARGVRLATDDFFTKPLRPSRLLEVVADCIGEAD